ncbi:MAG: hypothetical protein HON99_06695 [Crocinitomicaceae bacterium]|nr:hypothetical protein [Crocinitomicaceae bacterium]
MKREILLGAITIILTLNVSAIDLNPFFKYKHEKEIYVVKKEFGIKKIVIPFYFNKASTSFDLKQLLRIRPGMIRKITYTYADNISKLSQKELNRNRITILSDAFSRRLDKHAREILYETCIQTKAEARRQLFTGFVISFELPNQNLGNALESALNYDSKTSHPKKIKSIFQIDTLIEYDYHLYRYENHSHGEFKIAINKLKKYSYWKNRVIVTDVTGSMYPYTKQILLWLKLNYTKHSNQSYVFFNDGDGPKTKKYIGKTGGIYYCKNSDGFNNILKTAAKAMNNSKGNIDLVENDLEAIDKGCEKFWQAKNIVLIADNNAPPRDTALLVNIDKPVHVILCGVKDDRAIRTAYLNLAYKTNGSIHTMEQDLLFITQSNEGKTFTFMGNNYIVRNGKLERYEKT